MDAAVNVVEDIKQDTEEDTSIVKHKGFGFDFRLPEILQKDLEDFERILAPRIKGVEGRLAILNGAFVRTAVDLKWIPEMDVDNAKPAVISFLGNKLAIHINAAKSVPLE